jgi:hypothetical protein
MFYNVRGETNGAIICRPSSDNAFAEQEPEICPSPTLTVSTTTSINVEQKHKKKSTEEFYQFCFRMYH